MKLSPIELLPPELLQPIFLLSGPHLPLAYSSPIIATKLSDKRLYTAVCTRYLASDPADNYYSYRDAQTRIFASKWMTWPFLQSFLTQTYQANGCLCGKSLQTGCFDPQWPPEFEDATRMVFSRSHMPVLWRVAGRLPVKLLQGPWTVDKVQFLRFLLWLTPMSVDWADAEVKRIVVQARREALLGHNLEVVELFNHNRRLGRPVDGQMVKMAVVEGGCDRSIVWDCLEALKAVGSRQLPADIEAELEQWCDDRIREGSPKGEWLRMKMTKLRKGRLSVQDGEYEVEGDKLVVHNLMWNKKLERDGWFIANLLRGGDAWA
ncbi:hypothetical protein BDV95DRAFT_169851 [Massariosphaeria phaeospora]|uniref:Uncharacterized protein n=1 Tax=Massariosphaeria phaeospora TaxID=100035 RepID=A0A7C8MEK4_9PLEO|nr:hypothetical protein BDV95DRAFT_169851 [Massariosphaeria phaeospora]